MSQDYERIIAGIVKNVRTRKNDRNRHGPTTYFGQLYFPAADRKVEVGFSQEEYKQGEKLYLLISKKIMERFQRLKPSKTPI